MGFNSGFKGLNIGLMEVLKTRIRRTVLLYVVGGMSFILNIVFASRVFCV